MCSVLLLAMLGAALAADGEVGYMIASRERREELLRRNGTFAPILNVPNVDGLSFFDIFTDFFVPGRPFKYSSTHSFRFQNSSGVDSLQKFLSPLIIVRVAPSSVTSIDI